MILLDLWWSPCSQPKEAVHWTPLPELTEVGKAPSNIKLSQEPGVAVRSTVMRGSDLVMEPTFSLSMYPFPSTNSQRVVGWQNFVIRNLSLSDD